MKTPDAVLINLLNERQRLLHRLAPVLSRVGASHPQRAKVNAKRSIARKALRLALRKNADALAAHVFQQFFSSP